MKAILKSLSSTTNGTYFLPVAEVAEKGISFFSEDDLKNTFKNNERVWWYKKEITKHSIILSEVSEESAGYSDEIPNRSLYQIKYNTQFSEFARIIESKVQTISSSYVLRDFFHWDNEKIFFLYPGNKLIGPYIVKKDGSEWVASRPANKDYLDELNYEEVKQSLHFFQYNTSQYFLSDKINNRKKIIVLNESELIKRVLKKLKKNKSIDISNHEIQNISDFTTNSEEFLNLLKDFFPPISNHEEIKDRINNLLANNIITNNLTEIALEVLYNSDELKTDIDLLKEQRLQSIIEKSKLRISEETKSEQKILNAVQNNKLKLEKKIKSLEKIVGELKTAQSDLLVELKTEYNTYIKKGAYWKNAIYNSIESLQDNVSYKDYDSTESEDSTVLNSKEDVISTLNIDEHSYECLIKYLVSPSTIIDAQGINNSAYLISKLISKLGFIKSTIIVNADVSWITPFEFLNATAINMQNESVKIMDFFKTDYAHKYILIQGANRAPVEGYLGPFLKSPPGSLIPINNIETPISNLGIHFILQLDTDKYAVQISEWANAIFEYVNMPFNFIPDDHYTINADLFN